MTLAAAQADASSALPPEVVEKLHHGVRARRIGGLTYLLAPDGVTCVALPDGEIAALAAGDPAALRELRRAGFTPDAVEARRRLVALTRDGLEVDGLARPIGALVGMVRRGPRLPWGPLAVVAAVVAVAWSSRLPTDGATGSIIAGAALLLLLDHALLIVHELGHGIVLHWHGERVGRAGLGLHWGMPCFYVDATAALMLPRRARAWQAVAGVVAEGVLVAVIAMTAISTGSDAMRVVAGQAAVLVIASVLVNLVPALDLDGAWLLADVLDRPQLIHGGSIDRLARWYRLANSVIGLVVLAASVLLWGTLWSDMIQPLWDAGPLGVGLLALAILPMGLSCIVNGLIVLTAHGGPEVSDPHLDPAAGV